MRRRARSLLPSLLLAATAVSMTACGRDLEPKIQALEARIATVGQQIEQLDAKLEAARMQPDDIVHIELQGTGINTRIRTVDPNRKRSCKPASADCDRQVRWILSGHLPASWKVEVREKNQESPTQCFAPFDLDQNNRVVTATPASGCQKTGVTWEYDVVLRDQNGDARHRIDPLVVMTWAP